MLTGRLPTRCGALRGRQRGLSIVELMIGIAIGLIVVAAASMTVATQLSDNRRLLLETQVQQDLRAATDMISRDLRRSGYWMSSGNQVATSGAAVSDLNNPRRSLTPSSGSTAAIEYEYDRKEIPGTAENRFGFCQGASCASASAGMIRSKLTPPSGAFQWHQLTDDKAVNITAMTITPISGPSARLACTSLCAGTDDTACWPTLTVREVEITITGQAVSDPLVQRTLTSRVRLRNDLMTLNVPGAVAGDFVPCPAP